MNMKGRENRGPAPSADLLVCFPTRAHLTIRPKPICSPARPSEPSTSHHRPRHPIHQRKKSTNRAGPGHPSPLLWAKSNKPNNSNMSESEPTSPKVTCAGQIKVRPKPGSCKNWQSVMEEIERMHNNSNRKKKKKKSGWVVEALGIKKDAMQFLTCLRNIRFDFRCFGAFPTAVISSDDDEDDEEGVDHDDQRSGAVFSKWFMTLPDNNNLDDHKGKMINTPCLDDDDDDEEEEEEGDGDGADAPPPPNALMLMRCRSAPAKSWSEDKLEEEEKEGKERLLVMRCGAEFSKLSADIAKETWVVGGIKDMLSRSRSSRR